MLQEPQDSAAATKAREEAQRVRRSIGALWQTVLGKLARELQGFQQKPLPEKFVKNLKVASDQLRLDYRLDAPDQQPPAEAPAEPPADPLDGLRLVG